MNEHVDYVAKTPSKSNQFFWWCAGVDKHNFDSINSADARRIFKLGVLIFIAGVITSVSIGMGIFYSLHNFVPAILIAITSLITVIIVYNTVVSILGNAARNKNLFFAIPGILITILLGLVTSISIETVIFDSEIQREWADTKELLVKKSVNDIGVSFEPRQTELEKNIETKKKELAESAKAVIDQQLVVTKERQSGTGVMWQKDLKTLEDFEENAKLIQKQIDSLETRYKELIVMKPSVEDTAKAEIMKDEAGFLDKVMMLEKLSSNGKRIPNIDPTTHKPKTLPNGTIEQIEIVSPAFWPIWLVRLLFMLLHNSIIFSILFTKKIKPRTDLI